MAASTGSSSISCAASAPLISVDPKPLQAERDLHGAHQLGVLLFKIEHGDARSQRGQHVKQRSARGVEAERIEHQISNRERSAAAQRKNAAEEMSPGTAASMACSVCGPAIETESIVRVSVAPKARSASSLWSRVRTASRTVVVACGLQAGQQDAGLDLRAGNRRGVVDGLQRGALDRQRRMAVGQREPRAHRCQEACECAPWAGARAMRRRSA